MRRFHWTEAQLKRTFQSKDTPTGGLMLPTERKPPASDIPEPLRQDRAEHLLDSHEAAAMLKVHPRTLQRLAQRGENLPSYILSTAICAVSQGRNLENTRILSIWKSHAKEEEQERRRLGVSVLRGCVSR